MTSRKGTISVQTNDIFPIIKKWLYSEHDIFVRELISNACDAITKRHHLAHNANQEITTGKVNVILNKNDKTIIFKDNGLGMSEAEVEKYIAQLAFSGASEFINKMKEEQNTKDTIIGKFGLGFYSAFMVASKVEIKSLSHQAGAVATRWTCEGESEFEFSSCDKKDVGTEIILHINEDSKEFLDSWKLRSTLTRHCDFMPYEIELTDSEEVARIIEENAKAAKEEDKKPLPHDIINETVPLWKKDPTSITDDEYRQFYQKLFPMDPAPLFWIHLNVDHPFTLQGILYFPKFNPQKPIQDNNIRLYSKQVFVSDNVKSIIPDFLGLLKGAIDSTDIPLNVSRSSLQGDPNVKKISNYIIKKVGETLKKLFKNERARYEQTWEDIGLFVKYGITSDTKFDEVMREMVIFKNSEGKLQTLAEYSSSIPDQYKEKLKDKIIYFDKAEADESLRKQLLAQGIHCIETDNYFDPHFMQHAEMHAQKDTKFKFVAIDSEFENLMETNSVQDEDLKIKEFFNSILSPSTDSDKDKKDEDKNFLVDVKSFKNSTQLGYMKIDEQSKRFQQMTKSMGNNSFSFPLKKTLIINPQNNLIQSAYKFSQNDHKKDLAQKIVFYVQDLATISSEGLKAEEKEKFVKRSQDLVSELSSMINQ